MKKQYDAPVAEKVDFDYEENVVASGTPTSQTKCFGSCSQDNPKPDNNNHHHGGHHHGGWWIPPCWFGFFW